MTTAIRNRPYTSTPSDASRTITIRDSQPREEDHGPSGESPSGHVGVLRLRGVPRRSSQRVNWGEDVVDNEGCGKKKSKICCIYHKPKRFDESSSDESSDSDDDSDSSCNHGPHPHNHARPTDRQGGGSASRNPPHGGVVHGLMESNDDCNAYEKAPQNRNGRK
ncbi:hypothetical protein SERLADRAFT_467204 [Serpula lacrymans var. lacrymans S7.9]|uniref:Type 1 phosphatases regulator n=1 Tax=Serpula lacrymans var. lacrymans (strain S7.9) TaxID=578457 RepID=F8NVS9_SERL9|nr:uncharacterized protein SERLADRAFT_467204 [Serpula lacrymans var. lacrymans S7.9]EGO24240.1 hypothetical protein SERLADRAFT_467204 [Serpula lacrymans var. lacrymans S7.9]